jgi:HrpA-like RNA helicase
MDESKINYDLIMHLLDHLLSPTNKGSSIANSSSSSTTTTTDNIADPADSSSSTTPTDNTAAPANTITTTSATEDTVPANITPNSATNTTKIPTEGALLIFLPGMAEIRKLYDQITSHRTLAANTVVVPLHSALSSSSSNEAFQPPPPNKRKIVLATNIAETGITIPDVTIVIDTGQAKIIR